MNDLPLVSGPYSHSNSSVPKVMLFVMLALLPATVFGLYQFGWPAIFLFTITIVTAVLAEALSLKLSGKPVRLFLMDGSAILTGWLLAMTLPPWAPWWIAVLGGLIAIIIGKQVFGGIGQNLFNPAMVARVELLISFPLEMTLFTVPAPLFSNASPGFMEALAITFSGTGLLDGYTGATVLGHIKTELGRGIDLQQAQSATDSLWQLSLGNAGGSLGETSAILILGGGVFLLYKRVITWHIPVSMLGTLFILASLFHLIDPHAYVGPFTHLMSGAAILGAFFIATDLVTSPVSIRGQLVFGAGCGLLVYVIRTWAGYPEGVAFAVMLMNAFTPLIDHYLKPRIYGRDRKGHPINYESESGDKA
ncbi:MAG: RnfABCDGE type electron transport complex subunit D [gamma proteobacterium symbiont of Bathyaustriella thionipta]|nr:RnfABCDGE type electron transport complex subunit D [gamma proteobacterium symbiont of Bathyaustriella thionipta]MCU7949491.1 RnfABCDGE type electron transport complex subunit D [gamma proteobacterium symbiont of Bathyaustriella thionipta]MCU7952428.1 RnfABCDGE type electron transport complex subunit D [gamma proteobacterium symbiont of Bathyaustriella thionipta]MCU7956077.1 RnfABCDGE type electron transport complex subunit D [gamma proteobacterium symbiont of Bathyaustriella thionipta]MCU79